MGDKNTWEDLNLEQQNTFLNNFSNEELAKKFGHTAD